MGTLRSDLIRLAHSNPTLRPHLLPLLNKEAAFNWKSILHGLSGAAALFGVEIVEGHTPSHRDTATVVAPVYDMSRATRGLEGIRDTYVDYIGSLGRVGNTNDLREMDDAIPVGSCPRTTTGVENFGLGLLRSAWFASRVTGDDSILSNMRRDVNQVGIISTK